MNQLSQSARTAPLLAPSRLDQLTRDLAVPDALRDLALEWADNLKTHLGPLDEEGNRSEFLKLFTQGLGFRHGAGAKGNVFHLREKPKTDVGSQFPDVTLGRFGGAEAEDLTIAVLELKGSASDLDAKQGGAYGKTPVDQAFSYANKFASVEFVLVSNFAEIRLYARGSGETKLWRFRFDQLAYSDQDHALKELWFFLAPERLLPKGPGQASPLLTFIREAPLEQEKITRAFFQEFKTLRDEARAHYLEILLAKADPKAADKALESSQKLLNRVLFAGFAQSRKLLPDGLLTMLVEHTSPVEEKPLYRNLKQLFKHMNTGFRTDFVGTHTELRIPGFNGGLFRPDPVVDGGAFSLTEKFTKSLFKLANRDFLTELSVTVLGHCFEASLADLDLERGGGQRHDQGIFYTPDWVTRYLCHRVLGPLVERCQSKADEAMRHAHGECPEDGLEHDRWRLACFHRFHGELSDLRILDPACGSGAFLAAALRALKELAEPAKREALACASRLPDTAKDQVHEDFPGFQVEPLTERGEAIAKLQALPSFERCCFGVDLHEEAVLLTQLSLWLESAEKGRKLSDLSDRITAANSLTSDWNQLFPGLQFDAVIGNPPYVRMELFKEQKPHLKEHFAAVHEERADLSCYFFQLSAERLKEGGRYGIIVSNKWLKAKYGAPSRAYLKSRMQIEQLLDFGELRVFEDAAVMPLILIAEKTESGTKSPLRFAQIPRLPSSDGEVEALTEEVGHAVPASQLSEEAWLLVNEAQGLVFARRAAQGIPLKEYLNGMPICWGIKTGLNEAFWVSQAKRDEILSMNPEAKEVLKPLVIGDEVRRWTLRQDEPRYLIYTPKNRYNEEAFRGRFPALAAHLEPFRSFAKNGKTVGLNHRATKQQWFELQQAQEAYEGYFNSRMIVWPDIAMEPRWCRDQVSVLANTCYFTPVDDPFLLAILNSSRTWKHLSNVSNSLGAPAEGGRLRLFGNTLESLPIPTSKNGANETIHVAVNNLDDFVSKLESHRRAFLRFLRQDAPWQVFTMGERLESFWELDEASVLAEALKRRNKKLKKDPTLGEREDLKRLWREAAEPIRELAAKIQKLEADLDLAVEAAWEA